MSKQCEIDYFRNIGSDGQRHAIGKPFTDVDCASYLVQIGVIMRLLPPPPARILDFGCGTGWTSLFLGRRGYHVTGVDISADMLDAAETLRRDEGLDNVRFATHDYEALPFEAEFDAALFYDSLHHAIDEEMAVRSACRALVPGGLCITSEPGVGHSRNPHTRAAVARFGVTERDMPPVRVIAAGRRAGFHSFEVFPNGYHLAHAVYGSCNSAPAWASAGRLRRAWRLVRLVGTFARAEACWSGIVCMTK
jgi:SAM-dependent methyltransferase